MRLSISNDAELRDDKADPTGRRLELADFYRGDRDMRNNILIPHPTANLESRCGLQAALWLNALTRPFCLFPRVCKSFVVFWGEHRPLFRREVRAVCRKYECSADGGSSFNPLLFSRIVPPRCDLYDKIVPYVRTLNVLPFAKRETKEREESGERGGERGIGVKNCPASRAIRYSLWTRKIPRYTSCIRSVSESDELPARAKVFARAKSRVPPPKINEAKERSSRYSFEGILRSLSISMPIRHVTLRYATTRIEILALLWT